MYRPIFEQKRLKSGIPKLAKLSTSLWNSLRIQFGSWTLSHLLKMGLYEPSSEPPNFASHVARQSSIRLFRMRGDQGIHAAIQNSIRQSRMHGDQSILSARLQSTEHA